MVVLSSYQIFNSRYIYNSAIGKIRCFEPKGLRFVFTRSRKFFCFHLLLTWQIRRKIKLMIPIPRKNVSLRWWKLSILMPLILRNVPWEKWSFLLTIRHPPLSRGSLHDRAILSSTTPGKVPDHMMDQKARENIVGRWTPCVRAPCSSYKTRKEPEEEKVPLF